VGDFPLPSPQKTYSSPQTAAILCALSLFFPPGHELQIYHGNVLVVDNKRIKLLVIEQSEGCRFVPEMHQSRFGGRAPSGLAGGACALPQAPSRSRGPASIWFGLSRV